VITPPGVHREKWYISVGHAVGYTMRKVFGWMCQLLLAIALRV